MIRFTSQQWKAFNHIRRKHKVSLAFLQYNLPNILKFIAHSVRFRIVLKLRVFRKKHSILLKYKQLTRLNFDEVERKRAKRRKLILKQWSKRMVQYLRKVIGIKEYEEIVSTIEKTPQDVCDEMRLHLDLLKSGKRCVQLIENVAPDVAPKTDKDILIATGDQSGTADFCVLNERTGLLEQSNDKQDTSGNIDVDNSDPTKNAFVDKKDAQANEKQKTVQVLTNVESAKSFANLAPKTTDMQQPTIFAESLNETVSASKGSASILDFLMQKVLAPKANSKERKNENEKIAQPPKSKILQHNAIQLTINGDGDADSSEEFLGFADDERPPGMLKTPLVRYVNEENPVFISRSLDEYFRANSLDTSVDITQLTKLAINRKARQTNIDGLMTPNCQPPALAMPVLPESLLKLRTVAERRQYLQKCVRNSKLSIINNEAQIYRELQRKMRQQRIRCPTQLALQMATSPQIAFTRQGWQAASFINTELNKYYFQKLIVKDSTIKQAQKTTSQLQFECVNLRGVLGNNTDKFKRNYTSRRPPQNSAVCDNKCVDCFMAKCLKPVATFNSKKKLCNVPHQPLFKPCPLSEKPRHQLLDNEAALTGEMEVVRLPIIELVVSPELGKIFNDIAKRYLQCIAPYDKISREWAEFSVSTLQTSWDERMKKSKPMPRKTFVFTIPYANDRSQILVRRVLQREENVDAFFTRKKDQVPNWQGLSFRDNVDKTDDVALECADVLADMINSVAISCSEDSFVRYDTDIDLPKPKIESSEETKSNKLGASVKAPSAAQKVSPVHNKNSRLINELRRLNATIIDTQSKSKKVISQCREEFCALGCICQSLNSSKITNQHCGKLKCMFNCCCNTPKDSQIVRLESDGRSITTEDAVLMRRQATARLARMEKEFTSTIVVTENETLLINDSACEKRRRSAKLPKRYDDYRYTDDDFSRLSPVKNNCVDTTNLKSPSTSVFSAEREQQLQQEPVLVDDVVLKKLKHCSVPLVPFEETKNMAIFCLVHQLYKCFCGGHATEGKRVVIDKENSIQATNNLNDITTLLRSPKKSRYSFEKSEHSFEHSMEGDNLEGKINQTAQTTKSYIQKNDCNSNNTHDILSNRSLLKRSLTQSNEDEDSNESSLVAPPPKKILPKNRLKRANDQNILIKARMHGCSRCAPVPSSHYHQRNRKQINAMLNFIQSTENRETQLLLNEHIMRSVYFHKEMVKAEKAKKHQLQQAEVIKRRQSLLTVPLPLAKQPKLEIEYAAEEESSMDIDDATKASSPPISPSPPTEIIGLEVATAAEHNNDAVHSTSSNNYSDIPLSEADIEAGTEGESETGQHMVRDKYNEVIKTLNGLVSRKMHDIDNALKRDSKVVPTPTEDILCVLRWRNFFEAFRDHFIYVWEVKMKNRHFLAATIKNVIPIVPGALGVMNIMAVPTERLEMIGRMLMLPFTYDESICNNLTVIMQGRSQYWYIKGFLDPNGAKSCLRPTPETHPELTLKINTLCSSLIKQRAREEDRQVIMQKQKLERQKQQEQYQEQRQRLKMQQQQQMLQEASTVSIKNCINTSNVAVRRVTKDDIADVKLPQLIQLDHRWFVLDWAEDFTHIFMPELREIITLENIMRLAEITALKNKIHRMEFYDQNHFAAYFVPGSKQKMYFGPFDNNRMPPILVLLQKVKGEMVPRELYEKKRLLEERSTTATESKSTKATTGFWLTQKNGKVIFDEAINVAAVHRDQYDDQDEDDEDDDDEDDCILVTQNDERKTKIEPNNREDSKGGMPTSTAAIKKPRMNFTIQTSAATNALKISTADGFEFCPSTASAATTMSTTKPDNNNKSKEATAKILSAFKLPTLTSSAGASTTVSAATTKTPQLNAVNYIDNRSPKTQNYQHEFTKLASDRTNKQVNIPKSTKIQLVQPLKSTVVKIAAKSSMANQQVGGAYKFRVTPVTSFNKALTQQPAIVTATPTTTNSQTANNKITNISPINFIKAFPIGKIIRATPTAAAQTTRALTIQRIEPANQPTSLATSAAAHTATVRPIKRLSSGVVKLPASAIKTVQPLVCQQQKSPASTTAHSVKHMPINAIRIAQTIVTQSPTSAAQNTSHIYPVNLVAAQHERQQQQQMTQSTAAAAHSSSLKYQKTFRFKNVSEIKQATKMGQLRMLKAQMQSTTSPAKRELHQAAKGVLLASSFIAKKTAATGMLKTNQQLQSKILISSSSSQKSVSCINPENRNVLKKKPPKTNPQRHSLPNLKLNPPQAESSAPSLLDDSDVILIDD